jgi:hypothetical protein
MKSIYVKLHEAKKSIGVVKKNAKNPHLKNTYADLNALIEAVEPILLENSLILLQPIKDGKVFTEIVDVESGESITSSIDLPTSGNPQQMGSAITYFRRYTLQSLLSLQADDDDGQMASKPQPITKKVLPAEKIEQAVELIKTKQKTKEFFFDNYDLTEDQVIYINKY